MLPVIHTSPKQLLMFLAPLKMEVLTTHVPVGAGLLENHFCQHLYHLQNAGSYVGKEEGMRSG